MPNKVKKEFNPNEFVCCSTLFSTRKQENYFYISKFKVVYKDSNKKINSGIKEVTNNAQVYYEIFYELACPKNGCTKVNILQYSKGNYLIGEIRLTNQEAVIAYLSKTFELRKEIKIRPPVRGKVPYGQTLQLRYNKAKTKKQLLKLKEQGKDWQKFLKLSRKTPLRGGKSEAFQSNCFITIDKTEITPHIKHEADDRQTA